MKDEFINYLIKRLLETSTIRGIVLTVGALLGLQLTDTQTETFTFLLLGVIGVVGLFLPDNLSNVFYKLIEMKKDELETRSDK